MKQEGKQEEIDSIFAQFANTVEESIEELSFDAQMNQKNKGNKSETLKQLPQKDELCEVVDKSMLLLGGEEFRQFEEEMEEEAIMIDDEPEV